MVRAPAKDSSSLPDAIREMAFVSELRFDLVGHQAPLKKDASISIELRPDPLLLSEDKRSCKYKFGSVISL